MSLDGFEVVHLVQGECMMTFSKSGIYFSQATVERLGKPLYVRVLINRKDKILAIQIANKNDSNATSFYKEKKNMTVRWNINSLKQDIVNLTGWDVKQSNYRVAGEFDADEEALLFDLKKAKVLKTRNNK